jgi:hypothetical protein
MTDIGEKGSPVEKPDKPERKNGNGNGKAEKLPLYDINDPPPKVHEARLKAVVRHITHVQQSCTLLGERLILAGDRMGHKLIANGFIHDNSKFHGIEWLYLHDDVKDFEPQMFMAALTQHVRNNMHHPEYWDGIENMPSLYMAEMVCDWHARSSEFGTDLRSFIKDVATKKFDFKVSGKVYKEIKKFVDMLLDTAFVAV